MSAKPLPVQTPISKPFWHNLAQGKLTAQQCGDCHRWTFYPRNHCQHCFSHSLEWREVTGKGTLYSFTVARIPTMAEFADEAPQILAVVELAEGIRMNTTLIGVEESDIRIGMAVQAVFDTVTDNGDALVRFTAANNNLTHRPYRDPLADLPLNDKGQKIVPLANQAALHGLVSDSFTDWSNTITIDQSLIDEFAALSGDDYWIHTDPKKSKTDSPYGSTIAHGALVQILQSRLALPLGYEITGFNTMVNYGSNKLRFPAPVPVNSQIHARARVKSVDVGVKGVQLILEVHTHVVGSERPSVINELVIYYR
ncbi:OB-fold domain-containing protein [Thalassotalea ponticola]|uniref:OB-fold domain-containing protein n=1 Tax=Thalassotalea ponticola TaxID=1523392 RepID=UPI0025B3E5B9|nr:OB-fold domain-containing protein [Thalassotalea ponticola]MDN3653822.1 OB-fold domain-containing protein [Thalassotalea ponticola]